MSNYRRWQVAGGTYFFTVNLLDRRRTLLVDQISVLRHVFRHVRRHRPFQIDAIVILPDHLHCIWTLPKGDRDFSYRWSAIKREFSRAIPKSESRSASRQHQGERGIWQRRFWEHVITDEADFSSHADYIHYNPVKHGHCTRPADWPYSSIHNYIRRGVLRPDWGTCGIVEDLDRE